MSCAGQQQSGPQAPSPTDATRAPTTTGTALAPAFADVPGATDAPGDAHAEELISAVRKVTVYSDRARVTRQATAEVTTEPTVFAFRKLPGWVDDGSVRVSASAGRIVDVRVERSFLAEATDEKWLRAEAHHKTLTDKIKVLDDEVTVLNAQRAQIESIKAFSLDKITKDTMIGDISVESYADVLSFISDSLRATAKARRDTQHKRDAIMPVFEASRRQLEELKSLRRLEETTVLVTLQSSQKAQGTIDVAYMLPGATWEPKHELRVNTADSKKVEVISFAVVTQTSGEDWGDAEISFSTQSSVQSVRIPELEALTLGDTHKATKRLTRTMSSFSRAQQAYQSQNQLWNKVHQKSPRHNERMSFEKAYQSNMEYLQVIQSKTVKIFETLQKRGTTAHYKATAAPTVRGDGHPVRMRIGRSELKSSQKIVAVPEQSLNAARTLEMSNSTKQSFLPGQVALYQDGSFLGMTDIDFIAQGESFALFVSVADHLKLSRKLDRKHSSITHRRRNRMKVAFNVTVENLSGKSSAVTLADRIPVSENKDIKIENIRISDGGKPDSRGILHWELVLNPKEVRKFRISYEIEYPTELVLEARRKRDMKRRSRRNSNAPSPAADASYEIAPSPAADASYEIEDQLMDLEDEL
ncbi:MAG: mucoidy inhibitor MuiA family protein [Myxococcales bacterium]|nr:mucoidy inhibitor MuiA family protein [Myxococcales bacterium]